MDGTKTILLTEDEWYNIEWAYKSINNYLEMPAHKRRGTMEDIINTFLADMEQIVERLESED